MNRHSKKTGFSAIVFGTLVVLLGVGVVEVQDAVARPRGKGKTQAGKSGKQSKDRPTQEDPPPLRPSSEDPPSLPRAPSAAKSDKAEEERDLRRGERVEFDGRLIEGQTAAAGAIYLFERLPSELRSMVPERQSYRREVLETLYPNGLPPPAQGVR